MTDSPISRATDHSHLIESYLRDLRRGLRGLPTEETDDIVREIASHLQDSTGAAADAERLREAMASLGPAPDLAARYRTELQLDRAAGGYSPFTMMHALLQWASLSVFGFTATVMGMVGYTLGFALILVAAVKPFIREVGLWVGPGSLVIGHTDDPKARELLGWWIIPFGLIFGLILIIATSRLLRWMIGRRRSRASRRLVAAVVFPLLLVMVPAQPLFADTAGLRARVETVLETEGVPGAGVALLFSDGRIESFGVGVADRKRVEEVTSETRFRVGSITKSFTATLIMQLAAEGKLDLDQPLAEVAPEITIVNRWHDGHPVLIRHLLQHSTGFDDMMVRESWTLDGSLAAMPLGDVLAQRGTPLESRFTPGAMASYSNPGYTILGYLAEKVTGERYESLVRGRILEPLGMTGASLEFSGREDDVALGYEAHGEEAFPPYGILHRPAGSLVVSAAELARFVRMLANRGTLDGGRLLTKDLVEEMENSQPDLHTAAGYRIGYGAGINSDLRFLTVMHGHDGGMPGFMGSYAYQRDEGFGIVVLINAISPSALTKIARLAFDEVAGPTELLRFPAPPPEELDAWTGHYRLMTYRPELAAPVVRLFDRRDLMIEEGGLVEQSAFGEKIRLLPAEDGSWRRDSDPIGTRRLLVDEQGRRWILTPFDAYLEADPWWWRLELALTVVLVAGSVLPVLWIPVWAVMWYRKHRSGTVAPVFPLWPVAASGCLLIALLAPNFLHWMSLTTVNLWTVALALGSGGFGVLAIVGLGRALAVRRSQRPGFWLSSQFGPTCLQSGLAFYLLYWGLLGLRMWEV